MKRIVLLVLLSFCHFKAAMAANRDMVDTGNAFLSTCSIKNVSNQDMCMALVYGMIQGEVVTETVWMKYRLTDSEREKLDAAQQNAAAYDMLMSAYKSKYGLFCLPENSTGQQDYDILVGYLKEHPTERHLPTAFLIISALHAAFPCGK
jgi:hypothetical protein